MYENGVIVVGGGHGGSQAVASLRSEGYDGPLTLVTAEADIPYQRPPLSKAFLKEPQHDLLPLRPESFYEKNDVRVLLDTRADAIDMVDRRLSLSTSTALPFDRLILAPGARPRLPRIEGVDLEGVYSLREAADARLIRDALDTADSVTVVGGGFIGLEIAATARLMGKSVTILEAAGRLMGRVVAPQISDHFLELHEGWGSTVLRHTPIGRITGEAGKVSGVETTRGRAIPSDMVILGIGVVPNVELAESAGLELDNGIVVDLTMTTSRPEILSLGDCVSFYHRGLERQVRLESVQNAVDQAKTAAGTVVGKPEPYDAVPWFWSDQGPVKLQMVGLSEHADRSAVRGDPESDAFSVFHFAGDRLVAIDSVNRPADHMVGRRLIGAGISPDLEVCADDSVDLKSLIPRR